MRQCIFLKIFLGMIAPDRRKSAPGAWTQTPISAWLASVPIVPVLRNDHWCQNSTVESDTN